jgi:ABC-type branched-subunit amino acid transport system substrate-binding protein
MNHSSVRRSGIVIVALVLTLAACGRSGSGQSQSTSTTTASSTSGSASTSSANFGSLKDVCQPGSGGRATDTGVTASSIKIATFSDAGATIRPGLNQELFDAADVFSKWCNAHGGINGRKIDVLKEDAALFNVPARMADACQQNSFFIVGGGAAFDDTGEEARLKCLLPSVPGYVATPEARGSELVVQPVPNPNSGVTSGQYKYLAKKYPGSVDHLGVLTADVPATKTISDQAQEAAEASGFKTVYSDKYPAAGTVSYTPYVAAMKDKGVKGIIFTGEPETLAGFERTMRDQNYQPDFITGAANLYDERLVKLGRDAIRSTYIITTFPPFEQAKSYPALDQYLELFRQYLPNGKAKALLGAQGFSAWLLFAQAAKQCGSDLTRRCVYDNLKKVHQWTGGGLHAQTDPGAGTPSNCFALLEASSSGFRLAKIPTTSGIYNCSPGNTYTFKKDYGKGLTLSDVGKSISDLK